MLDYPEELATHCADCGGPVDQDDDCPLCEIRDYFTDRDEDD